MNYLKPKGVPFGMLKCDSCGLSFSVNPQNIDIPLKEENEFTEPAWRSPISGSHGFVSYVEGDDRPFYGCGETGAIWFDRQNFFAEIEGIIERYPHRKFFYHYELGEWLPSSEEPDNIENLIDSEQIEEIKDFERG